MSAVPYFARQGFTAADIMMVFSLTTMRLFVPVALPPYPSILAYLQRIGSRERLPAGDGKGRPRCSADADLRGRINSPCGGVRITDTYMDQGFR